jgi:hypothetical protein
LKNATEDMLIKPMIGQQSISKLYGDTIFDITSILSIGIPVRSQEDASKL